MLFSALSDVIAVSTVTAVRLWHKAEVGGSDLSYQASGTHEMKLSRRVTIWRYRKWACFGEPLRDFDATDSGVVEAELPLPAAVAKRRAGRSRRFVLTQRGARRMAVAVQRDEFGTGNDVPAKRDCHARPARRARRPTASRSCNPATWHKGHAAQL